jgi:CRP-like cAMP-binding protein
VEPIQVMASQVIYEQGKVGSEMYFVLMGEFEVMCDATRIGFLGQVGPCRPLIPV